MKLRCTQGPNQGTTYTVRADRPTIIGRAPHCDVSLDDEEASREHAIVTFADGRYRVDDHRSTNGVFVNDVRVAAPHSLEHDDRIRLGVTTLVVDLTSQPVLRPLAAEEPPPPLPTRRGAATTVVWLLAVIVMAALGWYLYHVLGAKPADGPAPVNEDLLAELSGTPETDTQASSSLPPVEPSPPAEVAPPPIPAEPSTEAPPPQANYLWIQTTPPGATVAVNGKPVGESPLLIPDLPAGRHLIEASLPHHQTEKRFFEVPNDGQPQPLTLRQNDATCRLESTPAGAAVFRGVQYLGATPLLIADLPPGEYALTLRLPGYLPRPVTVTVDAARPRLVSADLADGTATLAVTTIPGGQTVWLNDLPVGSTGPIDPATGRSALLRIAGILPGDHTLGASVGNEPPAAVETISLATGQAATRDLVDWAPDTFIRLRDGRGDAVMQLAQTETELVVLDSTREVRRIPRDTIAEQTPLTDEQRQKLRERPRE